MGYLSFPPFFTELLLLRPLSVSFHVRIAEHCQAIHMNKLCKHLFIPDHLRIYNMCTLIKSNGVLFCFLNDCVCSFHSISMTACSSILALGMMPLCLLIYTTTWTSTGTIQIPYDSIGKCTTNGRSQVRWEDICHICENCPFLFIIYYVVKCVCPQVLLSWPFSYQLLLEYTSNAGGPTWLKRSSRLADKVEY